MEVLTNISEETIASILKMQ